MVNATSDSLKARKLFIFQNFSFYEQMEFHAQLSMKKVLLPQRMVTNKGFSLIVELWTDNLTIELDMRFLIMWYV